MVCRERPGRDRCTSHEVGSGRALRGRGQQRKRRAAIGYLVKRRNRLILQNTHLVAVTISVLVLIRRGEMAHGVCMACQHLIRLE